jgi:chemotaxis protein CheD
MHQTDNTVHVIQGENAVSGSGDTMLTTVLGSCVAACLYDPEKQIGGMNHFLLPENAANHSSSDLRYAAAAMERLVNALIKGGAVRGQLRAKLFGGARMMSGLPDIGRRNGEAALDFLKTEGIPCVSMSLGGNSARRVRFWPTSGRAQQLLLGRDTDDPAVRAPPRPGGIELF